MCRFHCACLGRVTQDAWPLLREAVRLRHFDLDTSGAENSHKALVQAFLSQAHASHAQSWVDIFGGYPPRQTLARLCKRFRTNAHETEGKHNFRSEKEFKREARRITRWYRKQKRLTHLRRRQVLREGQRRETKRRGAVLTKKIRAHFRRLRKPLRIESFFNWRSMALITLEAGCPVHTGTVCCERYWALVLGYLPRHVTRMSSAWWEMLAQLSFCKHNYQHFSAGGLARIAERDAEVQSKLATCMLLARALHDSELCGAMGFNDLFDPFRE